MTNTAFFGSNKSPNDNATQVNETFYVLSMGVLGDMKLESKSQTRGKNDIFMTKIEDWMYPFVNLIVFAHSPFGEFIYDAVEVKIEPKVVCNMTVDLLPKKTNLKMAHEFQPGENFQLKLTIKGVSDEKSSLHLLSVDERVRYFGHDNDVTREKLRRLVYQNVPKGLKNVAGEVDMMS